MFSGMFFGCVVKRRHHPPGRASARSSSLLPSGCALSLELVLARPRCQDWVSPVCLSGLLCRSEAKLSVGLMGP